MDFDIQEIQLDSVFLNINSGLLITDIKMDYIYIMNQRAKNILKINQRHVQSKWKDIQNNPLKGIITQIVNELHKGEKKEIAETYLDKDLGLTFVKGTLINNVYKLDNRKLILFELERNEQAPNDILLQLDENDIHPLNVYKYISHLQQITEKIQQKNTQLEMYLDMLTHDLNNDFQVLKGYLEEIRTLPDGKTKDTFISNIYVRTLHSHMLLGNISTLMKTIYSPPIELNVFDIVEKIEVVRDQILHMYPKKNIQISTSIRTSNKSIEVDPLFNQMILNILTNAVKNDYHEIVNIDVVIRSVNNQLILEFVDYGKGIPPEKKSQLFERYCTFKKQEEGTGLGLHIIRSLVEKYSGKLSVQNRIKNDYTQGTKFIIKIPEANHS